MNFSQAARYFENVARELDRGIRDAEERSGQEYERAAFRYSSGPLKLKDLRKLDHPYARRHAEPLRDPGIINVQSGLFRSQWKREGPHDGTFVGPREADSPGDLTGGTGLTTVIYNADPKANYLEQRDGAPASKMVQRPVDVKIAESAEPEREFRIEGAIEYALKP